MPTQAYFDSKPPFPEDVPLASIPRISLQKLASCDLVESNTLFEACTECGFFLLDLRDDNHGDELLGLAEQLFSLAERFGEASIEEKLKYPRTSQNLGFKPMGAIKNDRCEIYSIAQDNLNRIPDAHLPIMFERDRDWLRLFADEGRAVSNTLFSHLEVHLGLQQGTFEKLQPKTAPSTTIVRMLHMPAQDPSDSDTSLLGHTDGGSITILFNVVGGLQLLPAGLSPTDENWRYVKPEPGCTVVNLGDAMTQWSGGVLRSGLHRVQPAPGQQSVCPRYSVGYFLKPADSASMQRLRGGVIPQLQPGEEDDEGDSDYPSWQRKKGAQLKDGTYKLQNKGGAAFIRNFITEHHLRRTGLAA